MWCGVVWFGLVWVLHMEHRQKQIENWIRYKILKLQYMFWRIESNFRDDGLAMPVDSILCIENNYLGDLIAITPALRALKKQFPKSTIDLLTLPGYEEVLWGNPNINTIYTDFRECPKDYDLLVVFHAGRFWQTIKFHDNFINAFKIGCTSHGMMSSYFPGLNLKVKYKKTQHIVEDNLDVVRLVGADDESKKYELYYRDEIELPEKPYVIIHPGSKNIHQLRNPSHWWKPGRWKSVGIAFKNRGYNVVITGVESEKFIYELIDNNNLFKNLMGSMNLNSTKQLVANADLVIGMDTGPIHIAAAFDVPVVSLMGPQDPVIWRPNTEKGVALFHDEVCTKCKKLECKQIKPVCMLEISVREVLQNALNLLES